MKRPFSRLKQPRYDRERLCWPRNPMSSAIVGGLTLSFNTQMFEKYRVLNVLDDVCSHTLTHILTAIRQQIIYQLHS